jgi:hypothetical protein
MNALPERQKVLYKFMRCLLGITHSYAFDIATVVTNQVNYFSGYSRLGTFHVEERLLLMLATTGFF